MCLNWADLAKNISFKSYAVIHLPQQALVDHILVWERVHVPWSGIPGRDNNSIHCCTWSHTIKRFLCPRGPVFDAKTTLKSLCTCDIVHMIDDYRSWNSVPKYLYFECDLRNCGSQIHVRKLACPCGMNYLHLLSYVLCLCIITTHWGLSTWVLFTIPLFVQQKLRGLKAWFRFSRTRTKIACARRMWFCGLHNNHMT